MEKTKEYIKVVLVNGKEQKRYIYKGENGKKYVFNQNHFIELDYFVKNYNVKVGA